MSALPEPARRSVAERVAEIAGLVHGVIKSEEAIERIVAAAKDKAASALASVSAGRAIAKAYGRPEAVGAGRLLDKES